MDEQSKFRTALAALSALAELNQHKLKKEDMDTFFSDMKLGVEQQKFVYVYLASKHIVVEGVDMPLPPVEEAHYTEEEEEFLSQYRKETAQLRELHVSQIPMLLEEAEEGSQEAKSRLVEHYMRQIPDIAAEYAHRSLLIQDLIQEGNLGLIMGLDTLGLRDAETDAKVYLEQEIHKAIRMALDEQEGTKSTAEQVIEKLNKLADSITQLTQDLGREVTPDEISLYLDMPMEEIEELLRIAGENIETADAAE